jgi:GT2 family glycosyltransferase/glycosyltransferase involved in cell wall biosynthesis
MAIRGHLDGMVGAYVVGWAVAEPDTGNCVITVTEGPGGEVIAKGRASRHRPDLAALGLGRTTFAFRIPITQTTEPRLLHVLANGEDLPGSPMLTGPGRFDGDCHIEAGTVAGWVTERVRNGAAPHITVINASGVEVGRGAAAYDAKNLDAQYTPARFAIDLDDRVFGAGEVSLTILANGVAFSRQSCNLKLRGNLEIISATNCLGWMISPDAPARGFELEIYRNGELAGTARTEIAREDVRGIFPDCGTPGFAAEFTSARLPATEAAAISLRFPGATHELFDGPYVIASRPAAVLAAYRAARLANQGLPGIGPAERAVLQLALTQFIANARNEPGFTVTKQVRAGIAGARKPRLVIIIPVYRGVEITQACIESVLAHRNAGTDQLLLINDRSPDAEMAGMLALYAGRPNVTVLSNADNLGFVQTVNRGLAAADGADVLLLNSDTVVFAGGFDEMLALAGAHPEIGTVTAISNNATIFSYPSAELRRERLDDISWPELAELALRENAGRFVDVPTGHGFCMFIRGEVIQRIGFLDEGFGRGYGEENDFCARSAALGYRHVAAGGVLVEHKESISFENERASLLARNLPRLETLYPEYTPIIMEFERTDGMRALRWALDRARLTKARQAGGGFVLLISNELEGGTAKAIRDFEQEIGYGAKVKLTLRSNEDGLLELSCDAPLILANFTAAEVPELFRVLGAADPSHVLVHQLLGFPASFIQGLCAWAKGRHSVFFAHDFYALCPRVTMIDAVGRFCNVADTGTCARCVEMGGAHETSRLTELTPAAHRQLFAELLGGFRHVLAPSANAAGYLRRGFPGLNIEALAHPESVAEVPAAPRAGSLEEVILLGAIGPHKGSAMLLELARRARLTHPHLQFRVIGYTNIDKPLRAIGNVTITGKFVPEDLPRLLAQSRGRLALFLSTWPETYSYTLSETVKYGFIPLVPDIGAPAERVRAAEYGVVFPFPINPEALLLLLDGIAAGRVAMHGRDSGPARFFPGAAERQRAAAVLAMEVEKGSATFLKKSSKKLL